MKFNKRKCKVLHLERNKSAGKQLGRKDLGILADSKLNVSQQCDLDAREVNGVLGYSVQSSASRSRKVILPLCSAPVKPHLECWVHFWPPSTREMWKYWRGPSSGPPR